MKTKTQKISSFTKIVLILLLAGSFSYFHFKETKHIVYAQTLVANVVPTEAEIQKVLSKFSVKPVDTPAVVRVTVDTSTNAEKPTSTGTAFFVSPDGYLVTNGHVVKSDYAIYRIKVDEKSTVSYVAKVVYRDNLYDLAVLKVEGKDFPYLKLISFDGWKKFDATKQVTAIGHPYGLESDFAYTGSIVGLNEAIYLQDNSGGNSFFEKLNKLVSTTMQLSPGDSGGPLLDGSGKVIGVNVAVSVSADKKSFMIPGTVVRRIMNKLKIPVSE